MKPNSRHHSIWPCYIEEITDEEIDLEALVRASELFTPADIEFAARKAAQRAFEREHFQRSRHRARTDDFLTSVQDTKPTLTAGIVSGFDDDTDRFARFQAEKANELQPIRRSLALSPAADRLQLKAHLAPRRR